MTDDTDAPPGFQFSRSSRLQKARVTQRVVAVGPPVGDALVEDDTKKAQATVAAAPADVAHGRPAGAGNALAFHAWKKDGPPKSTPSE